ncbi:MAG: transaldolase family protein [Oscillospiraceae bacterium]|nr:transaldolase family protein [Oscillospiraceae bacterium]
MSEHRYLKWFSSETPSIYWHDSAIRAEQLEAFSNGAVGMTTNPFLINATLTGDRNFWAERLAGIPQDLKGDEKVCALMRCVTGFYAEQVRPIFEQGAAGKGYVCAQTNPNHTGDAEYMIDQAKILSSWAPNIVVKMPATNAGIKAYEACAALGMNVAATVSFTVPQVLAVGAAAARGKKKALEHGVKPGLSIAVLMAGRLDDYLRDVAHDSCADVGENDITQAGIACLKKAYRIFGERGYDTFLMPAGCRGANQVIELAGARMIFSIAPKIVKLLPADAPREERIDVPVAQDVLERLMTMKEFRKAYEEDGMTSEEFITFGSANRTTDQFINDGWNPLASFRL